MKLKFVLVALLAVALSLPASAPGAAAAEPYPINTRILLLTGFMAFIGQGEVATLKAAEGGYQFDGRHPRPSGAVRRSPFTISQTPRSR